MNKTISFSILFTIAGLFIGIYIAPVFSEEKTLNIAEISAKKTKKNYDHLIRFGNILDIIERVYVDEPDMDKIMDKAIEAVVASLDPHSEYLAPKQYKGLLEQTTGSFGGLGIRVQMVDDEIKAVKAIKVLKGTPAERAGLKDDDLITQIDDTSVKDINLGQAIDLMRGEVGDAISLVIIRKDEDEPLKFNFKREIIKVNPVTYEARDKIGYIALASFNELTEVSIKEAIVNLSKQIGPDLKGFILDLRGNGGGLLNQAIYTADLFLKEGEITSTRGRSEHQTQRFSAESDDLTNGQPLVILINGDTASSSEIVAGALQDYERAIIIGTRSFGKGSVQTIMPLGDLSSALRITTARYYTPSGRSIQAQGIVPDWIVEPIMPAALEKRFANKMSESSLDGHLKNGDAEDENQGSSAYVPRNQDFDIQLVYALKYLNGDIEINGQLAELEAKIKSDVEAEWDELEAKAEAKKTEKLPPVPENSDAAETSGDADQPKTK